MGQIKVNLSVLPYLVYYYLHVIVLHCNIFDVYTCIQIYHNHL